MLIEQQQLTDFVTEIFTTAGSTEVVAREVADHLVWANMKGHDSHGVGMIPTYVHNIGVGHLKQDAHAEIVKDNGAVLLIDGQFGFGQVVGREATDIALERAKNTGIVCAGVRNCHHLGRIGTYGEVCGSAGFVSVHFVNVVGHEPQVSPWGGRDRRMSTNPFCCVVPRPDAMPIVLDMATSAVALGKVRVAHMKGEAVAEGCLVDHEGLPTTDASVMYEVPFGALGPFGKHKGYGLAVMCELLGGGLAGEWTAQPGRERNNNVVNNMLMFVLDPNVFDGIDAFNEEVREMVAYLHSTTPASGFDKVRIPGEPERESVVERLDAGIPIDNNSWAGIVAAAGHAGMSEQRITEMTG
ncbi:MAG: malate/lactate/ureidoglycolate dehydrogenase [Pseudomonadales bacterium]|jgi:uncharacterized oxidoreductase|nr:malate/lactate/ureidoglycolate dehydrogenase [Pseudomonadales bacterium]MDP6471853.1 malate/lactate/ureidoglycolate dehydrogenase [Pseudomonadales bacterium]MDP6826877.1 malate/lactate/ureidoglycolate dehydrogenase [Pseudomonadales bacterium]MDP6970845.1 malate/lactate/ureidoglycolate dehydrogenase [Pseudomonadales bacterium]|tara:strand:+ start:1371 stop:2435 length:1065 start_codon:yes stop_codon:yes gene_type:complete